MNDYVGICYQEKYQHAANRLQSEGYEDGRQWRGLCWAMKITSTEWMGHSARATKMDSYAEGRARSGEWG